MLVVGTCVGVTTREAGSPDRPFIETTIHVLDESGQIPETVKATITRDFAGSRPDRGEFIALTVFVRTFKNRDGGVGQALTATGRNADVESALGGLLASA